MGVVGRRDRGHAFKFRRMTTLAGIVLVSLSEISLCISVHSMNLVSPASAPAPARMFLTSVLNALSNPQ
jgi:hypothetical protein